MGRVSPPLIVSAQDRAILEAMCTAEDEQSLRAKIVLACAESKKNKEVAASLGVQPNMVSKWKEAYRTKGLDGIRVVHAGGRPSKYVESENIRTMITRCLDLHPEWNADDIAKELNLPTAKVYYELGRMEINLQRSRRWSYSSSDSICQWNPPLILVYRAYESGTLVVFKSVWAFEREVVGTLETRNRLLKEELEKSVVPVTLPGMLYTANRFVESATSGKDKTPTEYVTKAIDNWCDHVQSTAVEFHVFSFGHNPTYQGSNQIPCHFHVFASEEEMASSFTHWMGSACSGRQLIAVEELMEDLKRYGKSVKEQTPAFVWYSDEPSDEGQNHQTKQSAPPDYGGVSLEGMAPQLEKLNLTLSEYEELMEAIGSIPKGADGDGTSVGVILYQTDNKGGGRHFQLVQSDSTFQDYRDFDFSSRDGFIRDISRLTENSDDFGDTIAMANDNLYLEVAKKNKT